MQSSTRSTKKKPTLRAHLILAGVCTVLVIVSIQAVPAIHGRLSKISEDLYTTSLEYIEDAIMHPFTYGSIQPGFIRGIVIKDLTIYADNSQETQLIHIDKLQIGFNLPVLFRGTFVLTRLSADTVTIQLDQETYSALEVLYVDFQKSLPEASESENSRIKISADSSVFIRSLRMNIETDSFNGSMRSQRLIIRNLTDDPEFVVSAEIHGDQNIIPELGSISSRIKASGKTSSFFSDLDANLHIVHLDTEIFSIHNQDFGIQLSPHDISIRRRSFRDPVEVQAYIMFDDPMIQLTIAAENYRLAPLVHFHGTYNRLNSFLGGSFSGDASAKLQIADNTIHYDMNMRTDHSDIFLPGPLHSNLVVSGSNADLSIQFAQIRSRFGTVQYEGRAAIYPEPDFSGRLQLYNLRYNDVRFQRFSFAVSTRNSRIHLFDPSPVTPYGNLGSFSIELTPDSNLNILARAKLFLDDEGQQFLSLQGLIPAQGDISRTPLRYTMKNIPFTRVRQALDVHTLQIPDAISKELDRLQFQSTGIVFIENDGNYRLFAPQVRIEDTQDNTTFAALELHATNNDFDIRNLRLSVNDLLLSGSAGLIVQEKGIDIRTDLDYRGTDYSIQARLKDTGLSIQGNYGLEAGISFMDHGSYFQINLENFPIPQGDDRLYLDISALGYFINEKDYFLRSDVFHLQGIQQGPVKDISATFRLHADRLQIPTVRLNSLYGRYNGSLQADYNIDFAAGSLAESIKIESRALLAHADTSEEYMLEAAYSEQEINGIYHIRHFPLEKFVDEELSGTASASGYIEGKIDDPSLHMDLELEEVRYQTEPLIGSVTFRISQEQIEIERLNFEYEGIFIDSFEGVVSIPSRSVAIQSSGRITNWGASQITFNTDAEGSFSELGIQPAALVHPDFSVSGNLRLRSDNDPEGSSYRFQAEGTEAGRFILQAGINGEGIYLAAEEDGSFEFDIFNPLPLQAQGFGYLSDGQINLDIPQLFIDIADIQQHLQFQEFTINSGILQGSIRLTGTPADPDLYGTLQLQNMIGTAGLFPDDIQITRANLVFEERSIRLPPSVLTVGSSRIEVSGGIELSRFTIEEYQFQFQSQPEHWILVDYDFGPISIRGSSIADITIGGNQNQIRLSGNITAANTAIVIVPDFASSGEIGGTTNVITDLTFTTARGVEFFWPSQQVPILRTFARTGESIRLQSESFDSFLSLVGSINIQGGELFYFQRSFYLREGAIIFDETLESFDPRISISAQIREVSDTGPVTISLIADQNPLSQFAPRFTSNPAMSETEILTLLGQNVIGYRGTGLQTDQTTAGSFTLNVLDTVGQLAVSRTIESRVREALQLDMFSVRTPLLQNIGSPLDTVSPSLGQYLDNTSIFLGRYIGNDIFGELLIQLNARDIYSSELRTLGDIDIDAELRLDFSTPYFDFEWSFAPQNWDKLLIPDNQFSFSWGFSY